MFSAIKWRGGIHIAAFLWLISESVFAQGISFAATGELTSSPEQLDGRVSLTLNATEPVYDVLVFARAQANKQLIGESRYWEPGSRQDFDLHLMSAHAVPGDYHLLIEVAFRDGGGANLSVANSFLYRAGVAEVVEKPVPGQEGTGFPVSVAPEGDRIGWRLSGEGLSAVRLTLTAEPSWDTPTILTPASEIIVLEEKGNRPAVPNWQYRQMARLSWVQDGRHFSHIFNWTIDTDANGNWSQKSAPATVKWWREPVWLWTLVVMGTVGIGLLVWRARKNNDRSLLINPHEEWVGAIALLALTIWSLTHANLALWLTHTWSTGGDVASQIFYAKVFMEWLPHGKISGWLPESFAGFPAFTFYFPLPFTLAGLLQFVVGQQVAFKLVSMLPAFLLPLATYIMGWLWGWRPPLRLLAAAGAMGFILTDATSIWGGNVLAQMAGEFAYSWGMVFAVLFWGALSLSLRRGGRWWLLAGILEALVALSHGYALLVAGFGAFFYLLVSGDMRRDLRIILQVHLLAFLLVGFWLIPLFENLPWTIPNDTPTAIGSWRNAWPETLWPLALGWIPLMLILARSPRGWPRGVFFLLGIALLGLCGFNMGGRLGMADLRFYPYAQWAFAAASGAALGWALKRWLRPAALPLAIAITIAMCAWWEPRLGKLEGWSRWNLSGYESKPMWQHYLATAQANEGPLHGPRLVFEHDPSNGDTGSTRTLEALPMFGSRPALEGLYMESATAGPFIYQIQAEISQRPSSPLSRYPSTARSVEHAVGHLNEFYVDRVVLRSPQKKALFAADPRFQLVAQHGPLHTFELKELQTKLVDVVTKPLVAKERDGWLSHAFRQFVVDFPYQKRHVYLTADEQLPENTPAHSGGQVEIKTFTREQLVFETDRPGQPHLIRMTYHPRWASKGGEAIYLTEPSFMLIYPQTTTVELVYGWSWGGRIGALFSVLGLLMLTSGLFRRSLLNPDADTSEPLVNRVWLLGTFSVAALGILIFWWTDPEHAYLRGHQQGNGGDWVGASALFDRAFAGRKNPSGQSEALFWAARGLDIGGEKLEAAKRYEKLRVEYPESYWYPESVFRLIEFHHQNGELDTAKELYAELVELVPDNRWTSDAEKLLGVTKPK
jgi:hypothetical protein